MKPLGLLCFVVLACAAFGKTWSDTKGRSFNGLLVHATKTEATFFKYGSGSFVVSISKLAQSDREYVEAWQEARSSAVVLSGSVFQAIKSGALVKGSELRRTSGIADVPKWESKLDRKTITEKKLVSGWKSHPLPSEHVFVEGLNDVLDKHDLPFLVVWPAGFYDYQTAGNAARRVQKYSLHPPSLGSGR